MAQSVYFTRDSSSLLSEESLLCSICLELFTDPVTSPCGHSFCKSCITQCWGRSELCCCPLCKEKFTNRPQVKINFALREIVEHHRVKCALDEPEVDCDYCTETKQKALKSCLDCNMSYCMAHLEPHIKVAKLQTHKLINAVKNLADYICQKHRRPLEMFCSDDQMCVCEFCVEGDHWDHTIIHIEEETRKRKTQLEKTKTEVQHMIWDRLMEIQDLKHTVEFSRKSTEKENADSTDVFTSLIHCIERSEAKLHEIMEKNQESVKMQAEGLIEDLEQEITVLKKRDTELGKLLETDDHLHLLQIYSSVYTLPFTNNWTDIEMDSGLGVRSLWKALTQFQATFNKTLGEVDLRRVQLDAVYVTLDPNTANQNLILSPDLKEVKYVNTNRNVPDTPARFKHYYIVLGRQGFFSGRFYFEVQVSGKTDCDLGVVRESVNRNENIEMTPQNGFWALGLRNGNECWACSDPQDIIFRGETPNKIGVFVDYSQGLVSFHDVEARCRMYSFTGQSFTDKLYPFVNPWSDMEGKNLAPLIITPVAGMYCN